MTQLRVYLCIEDLQRQFAAYMATPTRARGYIPLRGMHSLIVEIAPALAIHRVVDLAMKSVPGVEPGLLYVERQFGLLEVHADDMQMVHTAGEAILTGIEATPDDQLKPEVLYTDVVSEVSDQHAVLLNRNRDASMILPGESLFVLEMQPAAYSILAANEAEKSADVKLVDYRMMGATGRLYLSGPEADIRAAARAAEDALAARL